MEGKLICIYGINNIGKSTQVRLLADALRAKGYSVECVKYPLYDLAPSGPFINTVLRGSDKQDISEEELQMWYTVNRFQYQPNLQKMLDDGRIVIAEDYIGTGLAWGSAKGAPLDWLQHINAPLIREDFAILLDGERFTKATEAHHIHEQNDALMKLCRRIHQELGQIFGWHMVNANQGQDVIAREIESLVTSFLGKAS